VDKKERNCIMKMTGFCEIALCSPVAFIRSIALMVAGMNTFQTSVNATIMEAVNTSETSVNFYHTAW
jgi:hypothetical protein